MANVRSASMKSPKVLFTRTSPKDNIFTVPSLNSSNDLTSELSTTDFDSDHDIDDIVPSGEHLTSSHPATARNLNRMLDNRELGSGELDRKHQDGMELDSRPLTSSQLGSLDRDSRELDSSECPLVGSYNEHIPPSDSCLADANKTSDDTPPTCPNELCTPRLISAHNRTSQELKLNTCTSRVNGCENASTHEYTPSNSENCKQQPAIKTLQSANIAANITASQRADKELSSPSTYGENTALQIPQSEQLPDTKVITRRSRKHQSQENHNGNAEDVRRNTSTPINQKV